MSPVAIHVDTDIGGDLDDLCALAYLVTSPNADLIAVTTTCEHGGKRAGMVRYALSLAHRTDIPIAAGADVDSHPYDLGAALPPEERYWPEPISALPSSPDAALDLLHRSIERGAVIAAIGPYSNLSLLERRHPGILRRADLFLMGGFVSPPLVGSPPWTYQDDYNVQCDTAAAQHVLSACEPTRTTLIPIEVTVQTYLTHSNLPALDASHPLARLIASQSRVFDQDYHNAERLGCTYPSLPDDLINFQHDPLACALALGWGGQSRAGTAAEATVETVPLAVHKEGAFLRLTQDPHGRPFNLLTAVDAAAFAAHWLHTVTHPPARSAPAS